MTAKFTGAYRKVCLRLRPRGILVLYLYQTVEPAFAVTPNAAATSTLGMSLADSGLKPSGDVIIRRVAESQSRRVAESHSRTVAESHSRRVADSQSHTVAESQIRRVTESQSRRVAESHSRTVAQSQSRTVADSQSRTVA